MAFAFPNDRIDLATVRRVVVNDFMVVRLPFRDMCKRLLKRTAHSVCEIAGKYFNAHGRLKNTLFQVSTSFQIDPQSRVLKKAYRANRELLRLLPRRGEEEIIFRSF